MNETIICRNLTGIYSDVMIGHEIVNSFSHDIENNDPYHYIYIPPYGMVGTSDFNKCFSDPKYLGIKNVLFFDKTNISGVFKLKFVALNVIPLKGEDDYQHLTFGGKKPQDIFKAPTNQIAYDFIKTLYKDIKVPYFTYKVAMEDFHNCEDLNLYVYMDKKHDENRYINGRDNVLRLYETELINFSESFFGTKPYRLDLHKDFYDWFNANIEDIKAMPANLLNVNDIDNNMVVETKDNFLTQLKMENYENLYTNFIGAAINRNENEGLLDEFFSYLVKKVFGVEDYQPSHVRSATQVETLDARQKCINKYLDEKNTQSTDATYHIKQTTLDKLAKHHIDPNTITDDMYYPDGQVDLYIKDDNYTIIVENKINSGINGKQVLIDEEINQLDKYDNMLMHTTDFPTHSRTILLVPEPRKLEMSHLNHQVITYLDLYNFFNESTHLSNDYSYKQEFLACLNIHAISKEEKTKIKFKNAIDLA